MQIDHILNQEIGDNREYTLEVALLASELKTCFGDIKEILSKAIYSTAIAFKYDGGDYLEIRCSNGVEYCAKLKINSGQSNQKFDLACQYQDIADLLPGSGEVKLFVTPVYIGIETKALTVDMIIDNSFVNTTPEVAGAGSTISLFALKKGLSQLLSLSLLSNIYKQNKSILFDDNIAQIRYPSVWVEVFSSSLRTPLDLTSSSILSKFLSSAKDVVMQDNGEYIVIRKQLASLYIPKQEMKSIEPLDVKTQDYTFVGTWNLKGLKTKVQNTLRSTGKVECDVVLFKGATEVLVDNAEVKLRVVAGDKAQDYPFDKFNMRLEFLNALINLLGDSVEVYGKGELRCLRNSQIKVLMSVKG